MAQRKGPKPPARNARPKSASPDALPEPNGPERAQTPDLLGDASPSPRIIGYARVSTTEQRLDLQINALRAAGAAEIHSDEGTSGITPGATRPGLAAALADLRPGDTLAVWRLDRLGRSAIDVLSMIEDLERRSIHFRSLTEGFDTTSPTGRAMLTIVAAFAELEREVIRQRVREGIDAARRNGKSVGRRPALKAHQRDHALQLLSSGKSERQVAHILGCGRTTIQRLVAAAKAADQAPI